MKKITKEVRRIIKFYKEDIKVSIRKPEFWKFFRTQLVAVVMLMSSWHVLHTLITGSLESPVPTNGIKLVIFLVLFVPILLLNTLMMYRDKDSFLNLEWIAINLNPVMVYIYWPIHGLYFLVRKIVRVYI